MPNGLRWKPFAPKGFRRFKIDEDCTAAFIEILTESGRGFPTVMGAWTDPLCGCRPRAAIAATHPAWHGPGNRAPPVWLGGRALHE